MDLRIGCCGFPRTREEYFRKFKTVEIDKTFYRLPSIESARALRAAAPRDFEFSMSAWQVITHDLSSRTYTRKDRRTHAARGEELGSFRPTDAVFMAWDDTEEVAAALGAKVIFFETPGSFLPTGENKANMAKFFKTIDRKKYNLAWKPGGSWQEDDIKKTCAELDLSHIADPFKERVVHGRIRYLRLGGIGTVRMKYKGWDLKRLRDFCEDQSMVIGKEPIFVFFYNAYRMSDAQRFAWIAANTGRIKEFSVDSFKNLCRGFDIEEEDEAVERLSREAEKIVTLILHTDYAKVDIEIEKERLRELCRELFPDKEYLYDMIYANRFDRIWEQFREIKEEEE